MKITGSTTLAELEVERMRLGVTSMSSTLQTDDSGAFSVHVRVLSPDGSVHFVAPTLPEAIAGALDLREKQIGASVFGHSQQEREQAVNVHNTLGGPK
jgi:hypothetical protein